MKIAQLIPSPAMTGPVTVAHELSQLLAKKAEVDLFYFDEKNGYRWTNGRKISFFKLSRKWREYDILHSHTLRPDLFSAIQKTFNPEVRTIATLHNFFPVEYRIEYPIPHAIAGTAFHYLALKNKDALVAITPEMKRYYQGKRLQNVRYIPNTRILPQPTEYIRQLALRISDWKGNSILLMTIGTVNERKNLFTIIPLLIANPEWKWIHIGTGPLMTKLKEKISDQKLQHRVLLQGHIDGGSALLPVADVLLLPSLSEGFPLVVLEAFQAGIPVVVNDIRTFQELFSSEVLRCRPSDVVQFSSAVSAAIHQKAQLTEAAYRRFQKDFSPDVVSAAYLSLYENLL
ncbi:glycosyltransferase family 4 protein [Schleiferia thermophila]|uniref:glycosyltransferase family 4 protein n=1 Tax=Schleiferia thermophila TaxID=884107 RepID=UPI002FD96D79